MTKQELTNEERQALIDESRSEIERMNRILDTGSVAVGWAKCYKKEIMRHEIVLAALTAEPVAYYWVNESDYGRDVSLTSPEEDDDAVDALENGWQVEPLIRIPKLTGGDGC